jgi:hypothetical protein
MTETPPAQPTRTQIPIEVSPPSDVTPAPIVAAPTGTESTIDTSFEANSDELPDMEPAAVEPAVNTNTTPAAASTAQPEDEAVDEDQPETAKSYAKRAREAAQQQADKTSTAVDQIGNLIQDAQERTRARIQSLTDILEAKDREQAASPLYNREQPTPPSTTTTATTSTTTSAPAAATEATPAPEVTVTETPGDAASPAAPQPTETKNLDEPKSDDVLSERLKRLSKPE